MQRACRPAIKHIHFAHVQVLRRLLVVLALGILAALIETACAEPLYIPEQTERIDLSMHASLLEDSGGLLTLSEVQSPALAARFQPGTASVGLTRSAYWLRISLQNNTPYKLHWLLSMGDHTLDEITLYSPEIVDGLMVGYTRQSASVKLPFVQRPIDSADFVFPLVLPPGKPVDLYLRAQSSRYTRVVLHPVLWQADAYRLASKKNHIHWFLYLGMALSLGLFNLFLYFSLREKNYLYYVASVLAQVWVTCQNGVAFEYFWPDSPKIEQLTLLASNWALLAIFYLFLSQFLNLRNTARRDHRINLILIAIIGIGSTINSVALWLEWRGPDWLFQVVFPLNMLLIAAMAGNGVMAIYRMVRKGNRSAKNVLMAFLPFFVMMGFINPLASLGYIDISDWSITPAMLGSGFELVLMSLVLAARFNQVHQEKERAQADLVSGLKRSEHELELRVEQRTAELVSANLNLALSADTLRQLADVGLDITANLHAEAVFEALHRRVVSLLDAPVMEIYRTNASNTTLKRRFGWAGDQSLPMLAIDLNATDSYVALTARERQEILLKPSCGERSAADVGPTMQSALFAPLIVDQRVQGVMAIQSEKAHAYGERERMIFRTLCAYGAIALDNAGAYRQLQEAQTQLVEQEKLAALGSLVAGVAHELNTPLGNSMMMVSILQQYNAKLRAKMTSNGLRRADLEAYLDDAQDAARVITRGLNSAAELINSFKQVAADRTAAQRRTYDLQQSSHEIIATMTNQIRISGHQIELDIPDGLTMNSYPGPYGQVIASLISNALMHAFDNRPQGKMRLSARLIETDRVQIQFRDDGVGIPEAHIKRIFEPFFTTKMGQLCKGLGLSISYNIVTSILHGSIVVASAEGGGACFTLDLPLTAPEQQKDQ